MGKSWQSTAEYGNWAELSRKMTGLVCVQRQLNCVMNKIARPRKRGKAYVATKSVKVKSSSLLPFPSLQRILKKEVMPLKRKQVQLKVTTVGEPNLEAMSESEQKAFYVSMLMRILDKRRQQLEEQSSVNVQKDNAVPRV